MSVRTKFCTDGPRRDAAGWFSNAANASMIGRPYPAMLRLYRRAVLRPLRFGEALTTYIAISASVALDMLGASPFGAW
jgi:hypothetical protein